MTIRAETESTPATEEEATSSPAAQSPTTDDVNTSPEFQLEEGPIINEAENENNSSPATTEPEAVVNNIARSNYATETQEDCSCFPHGFYAAIPAILSTVGWLARLTQDGCDYSRLTGPIVAELANDPNIPYLDVGFNQYREPIQGQDGEWRIDYTEGCEDYNSDIINVDAVWTFAKVTSFASLVLGGAGALFLWFTSCFQYSKTTWRWAGYELLFASIMQLLTYSWFGTEMCHGNDGVDKSTLSYGSKADMLTLSFWFVSAASIFVRFPKPRKIRVYNVENPPVPTELEMAQTSERANTAGTQLQPSTSTDENNQTSIPEIS